MNGGYTIFGQCDEASVTLVKQIARMGRDSSDRPYKPVKINHITISERELVQQSSCQCPSVSRGTLLSAPLGLATNT